MKNRVRLSILVGSTLALATGASATTITLLSSPSTTNYVGSVLTGDEVPTATFSTSQVATGSGTPAFKVINPAIWASAIGSSVWVSNNANSTGSYTTPYGYFTYTETFTVTGPTEVLDGTLSVMADDTAAVLLNGVPLAYYESIADDNDCADTVPVGQGISCEGPYTINLTGLNLRDGLNTLIIVDLQSGDLLATDPAGIDYYGTLNTTTREPITATPEPGTWTLLGSGLLGLFFLARCQANTCASRANAKDARTIVKA